MQLTQLLYSNTLLTYSLVSSPSTVSVSPQSGPPSVVALYFVISCPVSVGTVTVTQITFNVPIGDPGSPESTDLTETATGILPSVSSSGTDEWQIGPGSAPGSFMLKPASGGSGVIDSQGLTVTLTGIQVSPIVGTAIVKIVEDTISNSSQAQVKNCTILVAKFPYAFYAGNFEASSPMVQNGAAVTLSWIGSVNATYTILWAKQSKDVSPFRQWTSPDLTDTTAFILMVSAQQDGQTVTMQFSVTVIVADPDITATYLTVTGNQTSGSVITTATGYNTVGIHAPTPHPWPSLHVVAKPIQSEILPGEIARFEGREGAFLSITQDPDYGWMNISSFWTTDNEYKPNGLFLNGSAVATPDGRIYAPPADASFKTNHGDDTDGLALICSLRQEDYLMADQSPIQYALVNAVKELTALLEKVQARTDALELEVAGRTLGTSAPHAGWLFRLYEWCAARFRS